MRRERKNYKIVDDRDDDSKNENNEDEEDLYNKEKRDDIFIEMPKRNQRLKSDDDDTGLEDSGLNSLDEEDQELLDGNDSSKNKDENKRDDDGLSDKDNQGNLKQVKNANAKSDLGKVNSLDISLDGNDPPKSSYRWDNLVNKNKSTSIDNRRKKTPQVNLEFSYLKKDYNEQTIDYHKIKKEFDKKVPINEIEEEVIPAEEVEKK